MTKPTWSQLENHVRDLASIIWQKPARKDRIDGVNFDAVINISEEEIVVIEVTEQNNLSKIREDITKIAVVKSVYVTKGIVAKAYIVMSSEPTQGMVDAGKANKIQVLSIEQFRKLVIDYSTYRFLRLKTPFGSSIDPNTGKPDEHQYIVVDYIDRDGKSLDLETISAKLQKGDKLVLLGDYGTGKSRCIRELFHKLSSEANIKSKFTLSINLKDHWGASSAIEIIAGHLSNIGLSTSLDKAVQLLNDGHLILLLDGFDEVGAQTFGFSQEKRASVRKEALKGVKELIQRTDSGVLITGRPHYFNSDSELLGCLGINTSTKTRNMIIKCRDEFDESQAESYLKSLDITSKSPEWLPKKPLMFQILSAIDKADIEKIFYSNDGAIEFWGQFIETICQREARIHTSFEPSAVRKVLKNLAKLVRIGERPLGRISPKIANQAYENATGYAPDEYGQLMLSRLCTLGRIEPESPDRQFVDSYILQLLFAECLIDDVTEKRIDALDEFWKQSINNMGLVLLAQWIEMNEALIPQVQFLIHRHSSPRNVQLLGELVCLLSTLNIQDLDFSGTLVDSAEMPYLNLSRQNIKNITFKDCLIDTVDINETKVNEKSHFYIRDSVISNVLGIASTSKTPEWIVDCKIENTESLSTSSRIKSSNLPPAQKLFLSVIHKIFFQSGGGRKDTSLYKGGFGQEYDRHLIDSILKVLVNEGFVHRSKDTSGFIYNPKREYTARMQAIKNELTLSKDPLWIQIGSLKK